MMSLYLFPKELHSHGYWYNGSAASIVSDAAGLAVGYTTLLLSFRRICQRGSEDYFGFGRGTSLKTLQYYADDCLYYLG